MVTVHRANANGVSMWLIYNLVHCFSKHYICLFLWYLFTGTLRCAMATAGIYVIVYWNSNCLWDAQPLTIKACHLFLLYIIIASLLFAIWQRWSSTYLYWCWDDGYNVCIFTSEISCQILSFFKSTLVLLTGELYSDDVTMRCNDSLIMHCTDSWITHVA